MEDADDAVASLGLAAIADLCAVDALDFYAAWRVVHQRLPRLPPGPLAAAEWTVGRTKEGAIHRSDPPPAVTRPHPPPLPARLEQWGELRLEGAPAIRRR